MATWIKMRKNLEADGRLWHIADACGIPRKHAIGCLYAVWSTADTISTTGKLAHYDDAKIDAVAGVDGFASAMRDVGWLRDARNGLLLPKFKKYMAESEKKREGNRDRQRRKRSKDKDLQPDVSRVTGRDSHKPVTRDCHVSSQRARARGEKKTKPSPWTDTTARPGESVRDRLGRLGLKPSKAGGLASAGVTHGLIDERVATIGPSARSPAAVLAAELDAAVGKGKQGGGMGPELSAALDGAAGPVLAEINQLRRVKAS